MTEAAADPVTTLLQQATVDRLRDLELFSRLRVEGLYAGESPSPQRGFSTDFLQHRQYFPGDNLRYLDWKVMARTGRLFIKEFEKITNTTMTVVLDTSGSMGFYAHGMSKLEFAVRCAAMLLYLMFMQHDRFALHLFDSDAVQRIRPGGSRNHLHRIFERLVQLKPAHATRFEACFRHVEEQLPRKGLVVVFSDFMDNAAVIAKALGRMRLRGNDIIAFKVFDPAELDFNFVDFTRFRDMENSELIPVDPSVIREEYRRQFQEHQLALQAECLAHGLDLMVLPVGDDYEAVMGEYLRRRMAFML
ncbi:MAG: DUF58 domain-containing protein [Kiritimatiellae bacterium]|nr:DUF58 domain-containing protein [Kiritimatiellia bacterium]